jgi:hypothetical protein
MDLHNTFQNEHKTFKLLKMNLNIKNIFELF